MSDKLLRKQLQAAAEDIDKYGDCPIENHQADEVEIACECGIRCNVNDETIFPACWLKWWGHLAKEANSMDNNKCMECGMKVDPAEKHTILDCVDYLKKRIITELEEELAALADNIYTQLEEYGLEEYYFGCDTVVHLAEALIEARAELKKKEES